ncbi:hypothetical protein P154DRAFT_582592 [Amniculicola lignicola CBS 123094]|uniref:Uncharacterized protein n=1 Tax=Amniculicola lignicola CBS 123094 TaxID=1392246 RepID=A0A6A5VY89_9PLEO|nr:hypothetical protein P154DRAFT_582592 [Amniculicola lignicola CBS 123094]
MAHEAVEVEREVRVHIGWRLKITKPRASNATSPEPGNIGECGPRRREQGDPGGIKQCNTCGACRGAPSQSTRVTKPLPCQFDLRNILRIIISRQSGPPVFGPISITTTKTGHPVYLKATSTLDVGVVRGWSKISQELKERIMWYCVGSDNPIRKDHLTEGWAVFLLPFLRMTPEIAFIAKDIFCKHNTFYIIVVSTYPNPVVNKMIRRLKIMIKLDGNDWTKLKRLASGKYGFQNLHSLRLVVNALLLSTHLRDL